jgi:hypothetical protein
MGAMEEDRRTVIIASTNPHRITIVFPGREPYVIRDWREAMDLSSALIEAVKELDRNGWQ